MSLERTFRGSSTNPDSKKMQGEEALFPQDIKGDV